jgi:hypothetical protein
MDRTGAAGRPARLSDPVGAGTRDNAIVSRSNGEGVCQYCTYRHHDGWTQLLAYDDTYQAAMGADAASESTYGFHESWDDLRDEVGLDA